MTASASSWCRGNPCSTSASGSISSAQCAMLVASNGVSVDNGGWDCECPQCRYLLVDMGPDRRHPLKARAIRAPGSAGSRLDRMSPARQGLTMLVRLGVTRFAAYHRQLQRRGNPPLASISMPQVGTGISDFAVGFRAVSIRWSPDEGASAWQGKRNSGDLVRPSRPEFSFAGPTVAFEHPVRRSSKGPIVRSHGMTGPASAVLDCGLSQN